MTPPDMPSRPKITDVNPQVICGICDGYLIDATTIVECMHTFCRSCILCYLEINHFCPVCDVQVHKARPLLTIRSDKTWQNIVYKMIPDIYQKEMQRRRNFYAKHPEAATCCTPEERGEVELRFFSPKNVFSLSLEHIRSSEEPTEQSDAKDYPICYLNCPAAFTVELLKKFVHKKFTLPLRSDVDVFYESHFLQNSFTLMDVAYIYSWRRVEPMKFFFSISGRVLKCMEPRSSSSETSSRICEAVLNDTFVDVNIPDVLPAAQVKNADQLKVDFSGQASEKNCRMGNTTEHKLQYSRVTLKSPPSSVKPESSSGVANVFSASKSPFLSTNGKYLKFKRGPELKGKFYFSRKKSRKKVVKTPHSSPETTEEINSDRCTAGDIPGFPAKSAVMTELSDSNKREKELDSSKFVFLSTGKNVQGEDFTRNRERCNSTLISESNISFSSEHSNSIETSTETCIQLSPTKRQSFKLSRGSKSKSKKSYYKKSSTKNSASLPPPPKIVVEVHPLKCSADDVLRVHTASSPSVAEPEHKQLIKNLSESEEDARAIPKKTQDDMSEPAKVSSDNDAQRLDVAKNIVQYCNPSLPTITNREPNTRVNVVYAFQTLLQQLPTNGFQPDSNRSMTGTALRRRSRQTSAPLRIARIAPYSPSMTGRTKLSLRPIAPKSSSPSNANTRFIGESSAVPDLSVNRTFSSPSSPTHRSDHQDSADQQPSEQQLIPPIIKDKGGSAANTQLPHSSAVSDGIKDASPQSSSIDGPVSHAPSDSHSAKHLKRSSNVIASSQKPSEVLVGHGPICQEPAASPSLVDGVTVLSSSARSLMSSRSTGTTKPAYTAAMTSKFSRKSEIRLIEKLISRKPKPANKLKSSIQLVAFGPNGQKPKTEGISWSRCFVIGSKVASRRREYKF